MFVTEYLLFKYPYMLDNCIISNLQPQKLDICALQYYSNIHYKLKNYATRGKRKYVK